MLDNKILKKLYLEKFHLEKKAKLVPFAGYMMPINYSKGIIFEHLNTRSNVGLFDVSHMLQINIVANADTINKLEKVIPLDLHNLSIGKSSYSFILNNNGGIIDDLIISKLQSINGEIFFYLVLNASRKKIDLEVLSNVLEDKDFIKERNNFCLLAFQGPKSRKILSNIFPEVINLNFMEIKKINFENHELIISCSGYTGEDGFELSIHHETVNNILNKFLKYDEVTLCGLGSRDTLRLEAALCLYGNELEENITPKESALMWAIPKIRKDKKNFVGADKFIQNTITNPSKIRIGITSINKSIPRSNNNIFDYQYKLIGKVTSGSYSPTLQKPIGMGFIDYNFAKINNEIFFESRGKKEKAIITKLPFIKHNYKKSMENSV